MIYTYDNMISCKNRYGVVSFIRVFSVSCIVGASQVLCTLYSMIQPFLVQHISTTSLQFASMPVGCQPYLYCTNRSCSACLNRLHIALNLLYIDHASQDNTYLKTDVMLILLYRVYTIIIRVRHVLCALLLNNTSVLYNRYDIDLHRIELNLDSCSHRPLSSSARPMRRAMKQLTHQTATQTHRNIHVYEAPNRFKHATHR